MQHVHTFSILILLFNFATNINSVFSKEYGWNPCGTYKILSSTCFFEVSIYVLEGFEDFIWNAVKSRGFFLGYFLKKHFLEEVYIYYKFMFVPWIFVDCALTCLWDETVGYIHRFDFLLKEFCYVCKVFVLYTLDLRVYCWLCLWSNLRLYLQICKFFFYVYFEV